MNIPGIHNIPKEKQLAILFTAVLHVLIFSGLLFIRSLVTNTPEENQDNLIELLFKEEEIEPPTPIREQVPEKVLMKEKDITNKAQDLEEDKIVEETQPESEKTNQPPAEANPQLEKTRTELTESEKGTQAKTSNKFGKGIAANGQKKGDKISPLNTIESGNTSKSSFITYRVMYRKCVIDPNPIYLCEKSGTIVLNIVVNKRGKVIKAQVNPSLSAPYDKCLWERAVEFAEKTRFTEYKYAGSEQGGSIIYQFQGQ